MDGTAIKSQWHDRTYSNFMRIVCLERVKHQKASYFWDIQEIQNVIFGNKTKTNKRVHLKQNEIT